MSSAVRISLARQSCTALAPSVIEPPPMVTMRSASAARACSAGGDDRRARRVRRHRVERADAARAQRAADVLDLVGFAVQRAADHQEGACGAEPVQLLDDRLGCRPSEHDLVHGAEYDTPLCTLVLPGHSWPLLRALAARLAEEIPRVMPEDDAVGRPRRMGGAQRVARRAPDDRLRDTHRHAHWRDGYRCAPPILRPRRRAPPCSHVFVISRRLAERTLQRAPFSSHCEKCEICVVQARWLRGCITIVLDPAAS